MAKIPRLTRYDDFTVKTDLLENLIEEDIYSKLEKTSNTVATLPSGSVLTIGNTRQTLSSNLTIDTSIIGLGGTEAAIASKTLYYVYAVLDNSTVSLIASIDEVKPSAYSLYKKVGAFYTDGNSDIFKVYFFGEKTQQTYSVRFASNGVKDWDFPAGFTTTIRNSVGNYSGVFASGIFSEIPDMVGTARTGGDQMNLRGGAGLTNWNLTISNPNVALVDQSGVCHFHAQGIDAIQPIWFFK